MNDFMYAFAGFFSRMQQIKEQHTRKPLTPEQREVFWRYAPGFAQGVEGLAEMWRWLKRNGTSDQIAAYRTWLMGGQLTAIDRALLDAVALPQEIMAKLTADGLKDFNDVPDRVLTEIRHSKPFKRAVQSFGRAYFEACNYTEVKP